MSSKPYVHFGLYDRGTKAILWEIPERSSNIALEAVTTREANPNLVAVIIQGYPVNGSHDIVQVIRILTKETLYFGYRNPKTIRLHKCILTSHYIDYARSHMIPYKGNLWTWNTILDHLVQVDPDVVRDDDMYIYKGRLLAFAQGE